MRIVIPYLWVQIIAYWVIAGTVVTALQILPALYKWSKLPDEKEIVNGVTKAQMQAALHHMLMEHGWGQSATFFVGVALFLAWKIISWPRTLFRLLTSKADTDDDDNDEGGNNKQPEEATA